MSDIARKLAEPFDPAIVSWRVGPTNQDKSKGMALAYIDARDVMRRLDDVCGPENWQDEYPWSDGKRVVCKIGIRIDEQWIWKTDGAGDTDTEGEKGALSDAFKRAAVKWGIGRYLYDTESPWVAIQQRGKSYFIPDAELARLATRLPRPGKPADARSPAPPPRQAEPTSPPPAATSGQIPPPNPEEPPAIGRQRVEALCVKLNAAIQGAKNSVALDAMWGSADTKLDLALVEAGGKAGKEAAYKLRSRYMARADQLKDAEAMA